MLQDRILGSWKVTQVEPSLKCMAECKFPVGQPSSMMGTKVVELGLEPQDK